MWGARDERGVNFVLWTFALTVFSAPGPLLLYLFIFKVSWLCHFCKAVSDPPSEKYLLLLLWSSLGRAAFVTLNWVLLTCQPALPAEKRSQLQTLSFSPLCNQYPGSTLTARRPVWGFLIARLGDCHGACALGILLLGSWADLSRLLTSLRSWPPFIFSLILNVNCLTVNILASFLSQTSVHFSVLRVLTNWISFLGWL